MANRKTINLTVKQRESFGLNLSYFDFAFTFIVRILLGINFTFLIGLTTKIQNTIILKKVKTIINSFRMTTKRQQNFVLKRVILNVLMKLSKLTDVTIILKNTLITFLMKSSMKVSNTIIAKKIVFTWAFLKVNTFQLLTYDPQQLQDLDSVNLGTMDYSVVP